MIVEIPTLTIRRAVVSDAPEIRNITQEAFLQYVKNAQIPKALAALGESVEDIIADINRKAVFIAFLDGIAVGSIRLEIFSDQTAYICRFGVLSQYHSRGVGKSLMNEVQTHLIEKSIKSVSLHTAANYTTLVNFYRQRDFFIHSISHENGYARALMVKEFV